MWHIYGKQAPQLLSLSLLLPLLLVLLPDPLLPVLLLELLPPLPLALVSEELLDALALLLLPLLLELS